MLTGAFLSTDPLYMANMVQLLIEIYPLTQSSRHLCFGPQNTPLGSYNSVYVKSPYCCVQSDPTLNVGPLVVCGLVL